MNDLFEKTEDSTLTPGQIIKAAREAKQISLNDVAQRLLLSKQIITAIEADDYSKISAKVYAEGYLKAYAQFLKIPVDKVITSFRNLNLYPETEIQLEAKPRLSQGIFEFLQNKNNRLILLGILGFLILGILTLFVVRIFVNNGSEVTTIPSTASNIGGDHGANALDKIGTGDRGDGDAENESLPVTTITTDKRIELKSDKNRDQVDSSLGVEQVDKAEANSLMLDLPADEEIPKKVIKKR